MLYRELTNMNIFEAIRKALGYTQEELANELGVSFASVNRWENAKTVPAKKTQEKLLELCKKKSVNIVNLLLDEIKEEAEEVAKKQPNRIVLYHGSKTGIVEPIQPKSRDVCDFGRGFYMGNDPRQPLTLICDYDEAKFYILSVDMEGLKTQEFKADIDWALFVSLNRGRINKDAHAPAYNKYAAIGKDKDMIIGSIANDRMFIMMERFISGDITDKALIASLSALQLGQQYVAKTEKACKHITIEKQIDLPWIAKEAFKEISEQNRQDGIRHANDIYKQHRREGLFFDEILANVSEG